jgi:hypothetical protein
MIKNCNSRGFRFSNRKKNSENFTVLKIYTRTPCAVQSPNVWNAKNLFHGVEDKIEMEARGILS